MEGWKGEVAEGEIFLLPPLASEHNVCNGALLYVTFSRSFVSFLTVLLRVALLNIDATSSLHLKS